MLSPAKHGLKAAILSEKAAKIDNRVHNILQNRPRVEKSRWMINTLLRAENESDHFSGLSNLYAKKAGLNATLTMAARRAFKKQGLPKVMVKKLGKGAFKAIMRIK